MSLMQKFYNLLSHVYRRRKTFALCAVMILFFPFLSILTQQHFFNVPEDMFFVKPITYTSGITKSDSPRQGRAQKILSILSDCAHSPGFSDKLFSVPFSNPPHKAFLDEFYLDKTEVTFARYVAYLDELKKTGTEYEKMKPKDWDEQFMMNKRHYQWKLPVHSVTWHQANQFCKAFGGELPTSDQWEVAARNLNSADRNYEGTFYPWGDEFYPGIAQTDEADEDGPTTVCSRRDDENKKGVCDLGGNLNEWTRDKGEEKGTRLLRGQYYGDNGRVGSMGYMINQEIGESA